MMNTIYNKLILIAFIASLCFSIGPASALVCEREEANLFSVTEEPMETSNRKRIRVRGAASGSLLVCGKPRKKIRGETLVVTVPMVLFFNKLGTGPYFDIVIEIPSQVKNVVFGSRKQEIWPSDTLKKILTAEEESALSIAQKRFLLNNPDAEFKDFSFKVLRSDKIMTNFNVYFFHWQNGFPILTYYYIVDNLHGSIYKEFPKSETKFGSYN